MFSLCSPYAGIVKLSLSHFSCPLCSYRQFTFPFPCLHSFILIPTCLLPYQVLCFGALVTGECDETATWDKQQHLLITAWKALSPELLGSYIYHFWLWKFRAIWDRAIDAKPLLQEKGLDLRKYGKEYEHNIFEGRRRDCIAFLNWLRFSFDVLSSWIHSLRYIHRTIILKDVLVVFKI